MHRTKQPQPWPALILAALTLGVLAGACYVETPHAAVGVGVGYEDEYYDVDAAPPALRDEAYIESPGPGFIWLPGAWEWNVGVHHYDWRGGRWERPPHDGATWMAPRYEERGGRRVYSKGHWSHRAGEEHHHD